MAFIYEKPDPKGGTMRWMGRVKVGAEDVAVSMRVKVEAEGSKLTAQRRLDALQSELSAGFIGPGSARWLGPTTTAKLKGLMPERGNQSGQEAPSEGLSSGGCDCPNEAKVAIAEPRREGREVPDALESLLAILGSPSFENRPWGEVRAALSRLGLRVRLEFVEQD